MEESQDLQRGNRNTAIVSLEIAGEE